MTEAQPRGERDEQFSVMRLETLEKLASSAGDVTTIDYVITELSHRQAEAQDINVKELIGLLLNTAHSTRHDLQLRAEETALFDYLENQYTDTDSQPY